MSARIGLLIAVLALAGASACASTGEITRLDQRIGSVESSLRGQIEAAERRAGAAEERAAAAESEAEKAVARAAAAARDAAEAAERADRAARTSEAIFKKGVRK